MFRENIHYRTPNRFNSLRIRDARSPLDTDWSHTCLPTWGSVLHAIETSAQLRESTRPACSRSPQNHAYPPDQREQRPESGSSSHSAPDQSPIISFSSANAAGLFSLTQRNSPPGNHTSFTARSTPTSRVILRPRLIREMSSSDHGNPRRTLLTKVMEDTRSA